MKTKIGIIIYTAGLTLVTATWHVQDEAAIRRVAIHQAAHEGCRQMMTMIKPNMTIEQTVLALKLNQEGMVMCERNSYAHN